MICFNNKHFFSLYIISRKQMRSTWQKIASQSCKQTDIDVSKMVMYYFPTVPLSTVLQAINVKSFLSFKSQAKYGCIWNHIIKNISFVCWENWSPLVISMRRDDFSNLFISNNFLSNEVNNNVIWIITSS